MRNWLEKIDRTGFRVSSHIPSKMEFGLRLSSVAGEPINIALAAGFATVLALINGESQIALTGLLVLLFLPLSVISKNLVRRVRPETASEIGLHTYSFPSGHSYSCVLLLCPLDAIIFTHTSIVASTLLGLISGIIIITIGVSRVYLGAHYPSDVLGGWMLGALISSLVIGVTLT